MEGFPIHVPDQ
jgi:hypothetical protein